ncbi:hypothetical protein [Klebsiella pneumoniae IS39]|nr:hypothetical protein [Klebsiella pneumoniae IS39]
MGLRQQLRVVLFQPHQLIQGVERKRADAGYLLQLARGHILADILHHRRGARAFPADDRIQQGACSSTSAPSTPKVVTVMPRTVQEASWSWICRQQSAKRCIMASSDHWCQSLFSAAMSLAFAVAARAIIFPCRSTAIARTFVAPQSRTRITSCFIVTPETTLPDGAALIRPTDRARL